MGSQLRELHPMRPQPKKPKSMGSKLGDLQLNHISLFESLVIDFLKALLILP